jgi:hypothetical protein
MRPSTACGSLLLSSEGVGRTGQRQRYRSSVRHGWIRAALLVLVVVGSPADASAASFQLCGVSGCTDVTTESSVDPSAGEFILTPPVAAYYELHFPFGDRAFLVPSWRAYKAALGLSAGWTEVEDDVMTALAPALKKVRPWPPPSLAEVLVGGRAAGNPQAYLRLYDEFPAVAPPRGAARGLWIVLRSERASPWSVSIPVPFPRRSAPWVNGFNLLEYLPEHRVLNRNGEYVRLPTDIAELIGRDAGPVDRANGFDDWWLVIAGGLAVGLVAAGVSAWAWGRQGARV